MSIHRSVLSLLAAVMVLAVAAPASAQQYTFERSFDATAATALDIVTERGKIRVTDGEPGRVVVTGTVSVRVGWNVPVRAAAIARRIAGQPPIGLEGDTIRMRPPSDSEERRSVTVAYDIRVPKGVGVKAVTDSGSVMIVGVSGPVVVRTHSSSIDLVKLESTADATTDSGAVNADAIVGDLRIRTASSAINARDLKGGFRGETETGAVNVSLVGDGDVDVRTSSSAITLRGVRGALTTSSNSGRTRVSGRPGEPWSVSTGSSAVEVTIPQAASLTLDAETGSGSVEATGASIDGSVSRRRIEGTIAGGGPLVRVASRSGSITINAAR